MNVDRSSYLFKIVSYHVSNICNKILNDDDDEKSERYGTKKAKDILEYTHMMGSFESIMESLDSLTCKIVENVSTDILEGHDEMLYDYVFISFLNHFSK
jgi:hypothetical protein